MHMVVLHTISTELEFADTLIFFYCKIYISANHRKYGVLVWEWKKKSKGRITDELLDITCTITAILYVFFFS